MLYAGMDAGSRAIKALLYDAESERIAALAARDQGIDQAGLAGRLYDELLEEIGKTRADVAGLVATGYGRNLIDFADHAVTEISCHARGVKRLAPEARTIVDIGGQDSKLIRLDGRGAVQDFAMNDRCAAGTGRFLEVVAARLELRLEDLGALARQSEKPAVISGMCVVFAETEIVGLLATGTSPADIVAGVQRSIAHRVAGMAGRRVEPPVVFTGGVARVSGMRGALAEALKCEVAVAPQCQFTGALGAALLAREKR